ncbi:MAG TPA: hypothetical protein VIZ17_17850 [Acetobacteraceae bacterium]
MIALSADVADAGLLGAVVGGRRQADPGGTVARGVEAARIADRHHQRVGDQRTDPGDLLQATHALIALGTCDDAGFEFLDAGVQLLLDQRPERARQQRRNGGIVSVDASDQGLEAAQARAGNACALPASQPRSPLSRPCGKLLTILNAIIRDTTAWRAA